jgi:hypothetical protein
VKPTSVLRSMTVVLCSVVLGMVPAGMGAQMPMDSGPSPVLVINREYMKPGKSGTMHEKTEGAYIAAAKAGKAPIHYLAVTSMSGPDRALFLEGYASFAAWEAETKSIPDATSAALDHAMLADGDLLALTDESVWTLVKEQSMNPSMMKGTRYLDMTLYTVKPGHEAEWSELVKLVKSGYAKGVPDLSWTMYQQAYGTLGTAYLVITPMKSGAEIDHTFASDKDFVAAMGKDGMAKVSQLMASCVAAEQTNLFHLSPKMSIPKDEWVAAEPDYWKPKSAAPVKKAVTP